VGAAALGDAVWGCEDAAASAEEAVWQNCSEAAAERPLPAGRRRRQQRRRRQTKDRRQRRQPRTRGEAASNGIGRDATTIIDEGQAKKDGELLRAVNFDLEAFYEQRAPSLGASHLSANRLEESFGSLIPAEVLPRLARVATAIRAGGVMPPGAFSVVRSKAREAYGNHSSYDVAAGRAHAAAEASKGRIVILDPVTSREVLERGWARTAPLGAVPKADGTFRIIWDGSFAPAGEASTNSQIDQAGLPPILYGCSLEAHIADVVTMRAATEAPLFQGKIDVRQAYRQVSQHPSVANLFAAMIDEDHLMLDFRVPFGAGHSAHAYSDFGELIRAAHGALTPAAAAALPVVAGLERMFVDARGDAVEPADAHAPVTAAAAAAAAAWQLAAGQAAAAGDAGAQEEAELGAVAEPGAAAPAALSEEREGALPVAGVPRGAEDALRRGGEVAAAAAFAEEVAEPGAAAPAALAEEGEGDLPVVGVPRGADEALKRGGVAAAAAVFAKVEVEPGAAAPALSHEEGGQAEGVSGGSGQRQGSGAAAAGAATVGSGASRPRQLVGVEFLRERGLERLSMAHNFVGQVYADDWFNCEPAERYALSGKAALWCHEVAFGPEGVCQAKLRAFGKGRERQPILGVELDTHAGVLRLPTEKQKQLRDLLAATAGRSAIPLQEMLSLIGKLRHFAECVLAGRFFLRPLIALTRRHGGGGAGGGQQGTSNHRGRRPQWQKNLLHLDEAALGALEVWRALLAAAATAPHLLECPLESRVQRPAAAVFETDASLFGAGGIWGAQGRYFQHIWPPAVVAAFVAGDLTINDLEMAGLVLAMGTFAAADGPAAEQLRLQPVLLRGDNVSSLAWVRQGGGHGAVADALAGFAGLLAAEGQCSFLTEHIPGATNFLPDALSRKALPELLATARADSSCVLAPLLQWTRRTVPAALASAVSSLLLTPNCGPALARVQRWHTLPPWSLSGASPQ